MPTQIKYTKGDATVPANPLTVIPHVVNNQGIWGAGFALALGKRYPKAREDYLARHGAMGLEIGDTIFTEMVRPVKRSIIIVSIVGQHGLKTRGNPHPVRYGGIERGLKTLAAWCNTHPGYVVQMPRIGCGLAGGEWSIVEKVIQQQLCEAEIPVIVFDLS